eukprot:TRINITY_DN13488_c0_g1_i1.p1 TRINITY_DN13488_c0_g1~~TRINITY_DN13488_c0_g1_i1.p1  ORF type:complete len:304 (-),score=56.95 TRINITY_DN13488_c0_g1_i1:234-1145(-)
MNAPRGASGSQKGLRSRVDDGQILKAVDSLVKWVQSQKDKLQKLQLVEDEELFYIVVSLKKIPEVARTNPYRIPLPHPPFPLDGSREVCLFVSDRGTGLKQKGAKAKVAEEGICIQKVIALSKLKKDYFAHEAKRKLCGSYDLFLSDDRILSELPKCLGKTFYKKKKHPIPVTLSRGQWKGQITAACNSTFLYIGGGTCSVVKVAMASQARDEIKENIKAAIEGIAGVVPKKWKNIQSIFLKSSESVSLPLYQALPDLPMKIEVGKKAGFEDLEKPQKRKQVVGDEQVPKKKRKAKDTKRASG